MKALKLLSVIRSAVLAVALLAFPAVSTRADVIISNLGSAHAQFRAGGYTAMGFTMGTESYTLTDVELSLVVFSGVPPLITLNANNGGTPGVALEAFTNPSFGSNQQNYTFTPTSPFTLAANTTYWLTAALNDSRWYYASVDATGIATSVGFALFSPDAGASWITDTGTYRAYQVNGSPPAASTAAPVPEPSSLLLACVAGCGSLLPALRRRFRRRATSPSPAETTPGSS